jgi:ferric-dicitrate binding protein FerR (iron transport regulator)
MDANERRARATHEATQWWNRLGIERPSEISRADREAFTQWLRESPLHVAEILRVAHVHDALERFKLWDEIEVGDAGEPQNVVQLREVADGPAPSAGSQSAEAAGPVRRARVARWAIAAGICFVAVMAGWFALGARGQLIETELAERRQVMLDDGTVVQLEPETRLRVRLEDHNRYVALEHGRALFRVAKDAQRPFWVSTDRTTVRAVGTAFGVESGERGVIVTVAEGKVAVASKTSAGNGAAAQAPAAEIFLTAGQQLTVQSSGAADRVRAVDTTRALAWAQGQLVFENQTLADVVAEFNRYNRTQLRISDPQLATRRVSGVFEATDMETLLAFIRQGARDISVSQTDEGIVIGPAKRGAN